MGTPWDVATDTCLNLVILLHVSVGSTPDKCDRSTEDEHDNYGYDSGPLQKDGHA